MAGAGNLDDNARGIRNIQNLKMHRHATSSLKETAGQDWTEESVPLRLSFPATTHYPPYLFFGHPCPMQILAPK